MECVDLTLDIEPCEHLNCNKYSCGTFAAFLWHFLQFVVHAPVYSCYASMFTKSHACTCQFFTFLSSIAKHLRRGSVVNKLQCRRAKKESKTMQKLLFKRVVISLDGTGVRHTLWSKVIQYIESNSCIMMHSIRLLPLRKDKPTTTCWKIRTLSLTLRWNFETTFIRYPCGESQYPHDMVCCKIHGVVSDLKWAGGAELLLETESYLG